MIHLRTIIFTVGVILGISIGEKSVYGSEVAMASLLLFIFQFVVWLKSKRVTEQGGAFSIERSEVACMTMILALGLSIGVVRMQFVEEGQRLVCEKVCEVTGRVVTLPEMKDEYQIFDITPTETSDSSEMMHVRVRVPLYPEYEIGDTITLLGKVMEPKVLYAHGEKKSFDYASYLKIHTVGSEMYYPKVIQVEKEGALTFSEQLKKLNHSLVNTISFYVSSPASSLASGMLLGSDTMSKELTETFSATGLSHIVVLSGFNIAIVIGVLLLVLRPLPLSIRVVSAGIAVILFVIMVGATPSVVRAVLMAFIALTALMFGRGYVPYQALILSLLAIVLYSPETIQSDVSLHLSFLATAGIMYLRDGIQKIISHISEKISTSMYGEIITTTVSAYVMTLPYVMYTFGTLSIYAIITNAIVLPLVPVVMFLTGIVLLVGSLSIFLGNVFGYIVSLLCDLIILIARLVESFPYAKMSSYISLTTMCVMYIVLVLFFIFLKLYKRNETRVTKDGEIISDIISF